MRILLVTDYATLTGGAEISQFGLRSALRERGHTVRWLSTTARPGPGPSAADVEGLGTTSRWRTLLQTANPWAAAALRRELDRFRPDVVHVKIFLTQLSPLILPVLRGVPSLLHIAWYRVICPTGTKWLPRGAACTHTWGKACLDEHCLPLRDWLPLMAQRQMLHQWRGAFSAVVANSRATARLLEQSGFGAVASIHNGAPARPARPPLAHPPLIAYAGRLVPEKGVGVLLRAFAQVRAALPAARLLIAGEGPQRQALEALARDLDLTTSVEFAGHLAAAEAEGRLGAAWVQVVPSLWAEPFGIVAIEAMHRSTAVVASRTGGLTEIVREGQTGYLTPPGNAPALAQHLVRLLHDPALAERLGAAARHVAQTDFSLDRYADNFVDLYARIAAAGAPVASQVTIPA